MDFSEYENIEIFNNTQSFTQINKIIGKLLNIYRERKNRPGKVSSDTHFLKKGSMQIYFKESVRNITRDFNFMIITKQT